MKISIESYGNTITHEISGDDVNVAKALQVFVTLMIAAGYNEKGIQEYFVNGQSPLEWDMTG